MAFDKEIIESRLELIEENLRVLQEMQSLSFEELSSAYQKIDSCKYRLQTSIQALLDLLCHVISRIGFRVPKGNIDAIHVLRENSLISQEQTDRYINLARFLNRVIHNYEKIDVAELYGILQNELTTIREFVKDINRIIHKFSGGEK